MNTARLHRCVADSPGVLGLSTRTFQSDVSIKRRLVMLMLDSPLPTSAPGSPSKSCTRTRAGANNGNCAPNTTRNSDCPAKKFECVHPSLFSVTIVLH
jgi:hypothetical protein